MNKIGPAVRKIREIKNLTQNYIARQLQVSRSWYIQFECGEKDIKLDMLRKLSEIFQMKTDEILRFAEMEIKEILNPCEKTVIVREKDYEQSKILYEALLHEKDLRIAALESIIALQKLPKLNKKGHVSDL